jgi:uncharacterized protein with PCYCGC motif
MRNRVIVPVMAGMLFVSFALTTGVGQKLQSQTSATSVGTSIGSKSATVRKSSHAYHDGPPTAALPATSDPAQFYNNKTAFVVYSIAAKIPDLLYQMPCYCGCDKTENHQSLHECYVVKHGVGCPACQKGAVVTYEQSKLGKTAAQIRDAMEKGEVWNFDVDLYAEKHYAEYKHQHDGTNLHSPKR